MITKPKPYGIGIVGTGRISDLHAIEYLQNPHARIVALCDQDVELARRRASKWKVDDARITDDVDELLADPAVDLVEILLPHHLHLSAAGKGHPGRQDRLPSEADVHVHGRGRPVGGGGRTF